MGEQTEIQEPEMVDLGDAALELVAGGAGIQIDGNGRSGA